MDGAVDTFLGRIRPALAGALLVALGLLSSAEALSHEGREDSDRGHETRSERRESSDGRKGRDRETGRERDDDRASSRLTDIDVERDRRGHERIREEVLMVADTTAIGAVRAAGYFIVEERTLDALGEILARIRVRTGVSVDQTIQELQALAPQASIAPHDIFRPSADTAENIAVRTGTTDVPSQAHVGIVDTGADDSLASLKNAVVEQQGFVDGSYVPRMHGTVVAEIAALAGAHVSVADVFGVDDDKRLVAPAAAIAGAINWLLVRRVRVINISIEGPDNLVLAHVIERALAKDVAIVAAAGNGGPAAKPVFPAAYPGVVAVTAVDEHGQVYRRANRGDYIAFAARGVRISTKWQASSSKTLSGTSFASPIVATILAQRLATTSEQHISDVVATLRNEARDLGAPGRDTTYGWGELVLPEVRTADAVAHRAISITKR